MKCFQEVGWKSESFDLRLAKIDEEKNLNESEIVDILAIKIKCSDYIYVIERSEDSVHPFDIVLGNEKSLELIGMEIKGDNDNYDRLMNQIDRYLNIFDEVYLVLHKKKAPEWLPSNIGIVRLFDNGDVFIEKHAYQKSSLDVSTNFEWDALFNANGLGLCGNKTKELLKLVDGVRKNVLFNRFFGKIELYNTKTFTKFYPLDDKQKELIIGFDVPHHIKNLNKDLNNLEKRFELLKNTIKLK